MIENSRNTYLSILEQVIQQDLDKDRLNQFKKIGLLREGNEISHDIWQVSSLEKCFNQKDEQLLTADLMINHMFQQTRYKINDHYQRLMMQMLFYFINNIDTKFE